MNETEIQSQIALCIKKQIKNADLTKSFNENSATSLDALIIVSNLKSQGIELSIFDLFSSDTLNDITTNNQNLTQESMSTMPFIEIGRWQKRRAGNPNYLFINRVLKVENTLANDVELFFQSLIQEVPILTANFDFETETIAYQPADPFACIHYYSMASTQSDEDLYTALEKEYLPVLNKADLSNGGFHLFRFDGDADHTYFVVSINHAVTDWTSLQEIYAKMKLYFNAGGDANLSELAGFSTVVEKIQAISQNISIDSIAFWEDKLPVLKHENITSSKANIESQCSELLGNTTLNMNNEQFHLAAFLVKLVESFSQAVPSQYYVFELCYTLRALLGDRLDLTKTNGHLMQPVWLCIDMGEMKAATDPEAWMQNEIEQHKEHCFSLDWLRNNNHDYSNLPTPLASINFKFGVESHFSVNDIFDGIDVMRDNFIFDPNFYRSCEFYIECNYLDNGNVDYLLSFNTERIQRDVGESLHNFLSLK